MTARIIILLMCILMTLSGYHARADQDLHSDYFRRIAQSEDRTPTERTDAFRMLLQVDSTAISDPIVFTIVQLHLSQKEYSRADSLLEILSNKNNNSIPRICQLLNSKGWAAFYQQNYSMAMENALNLLKEKKPDSLQYRNAEAYLLMSDIFNIINNYSFGEKCARHAIEIINKTNYKDRKLKETQALICLSNALIGQGKNKEAFPVLKKARELATEPFHINAITGTLASLYAANGDNDIAEDYFREAIKLQGNPINRAAQVLNLIGLKFSEGDYVAMKAIMADNDSVLRNISNPNMLRGKNEARAYILAHEGKTDEAFNALAEALKASDSAHTAERTIYTRQLSAQFEERLTSIEKGNSLTSQLIPWLWVTGTVTVLTIIYYCYRHFKRQQLKEREEYRSQIDSLSTRLSEIKGESKADMEESNQRLMSMAMHLARVTEGLNQIDKLTDEDTLNADKRMKEIKLLLRQLSSEDNLWEMFKTYFEQVNQSFFNNLFIVQPNLTNAEVRMSAFIFMNLTSKEIAAITNRSVRTVESIKYNLRKKLAITEPTEIFMRKLALADKETLEELREQQEKLRQEKESTES